MKIAVNTRLLLPDRLDGIGWYSYETLRRITRSHPEHEFIFFFDRAYSYEFIFSGNIKPVVLPPQSRHPVLWHIWFEWSVTSALKKYQADLFLSPDGYLSLSTTVPSIAVIHDINFHHRPQDLPLANRIYYRHYFPKFAGKATRIVTVSNYSKQDICTSYNIPEKKVRVVYNGAGESYGPISDDAANEVRANYTSGLPYFVFVGTLHPRKNIPRLLKAFDGFRRTFPEPYKMVIVGERMFLTSEIITTIKQMQHSDDIVFTGRLSPGELKNVIGGATALTFVPLFEGFGIPLLEAMYCDTPVMASDVTSLPEVGGDAVLYVDPFDIETIRYGMEQLAGDENLRNELVARGRSQRTKFSWDKSAEGLWQEIEEVLGERY
jgi:glycosyltransferase involved in cell wall biosynthesis